MESHHRVEQRQGEDGNMWAWPTLDRRCWKAMIKHWFMAEKVMELTSQYHKDIDKNVMIQAGGNVGVYAWQYAQMFDSVYTFEPEDLNFYCLERNIADQKNIKATKAFLGKQSGTAGIKNHANDKAVARTDKYPDGRPTEYNTGAYEINGIGEIPVIDIDSMNLPQCDLIHLDIEGSELDALKGAENTIKQHKPILCLEWFYNTDILKDVLDDWGYEEIAMAMGSDKIFRLK